MSPEQEAAAGVTTTARQTPGEPAEISIGVRYGHTTALRHASLCK
ncbi:MAG TPA: hypothetical protein VGP63_24900 [Planctomycetaceae bacterium]|nr:hypothetical protein [Planctomycetaceae bacterium]